MMHLTHRSCSSCIFWSDTYRHQNIIIRAICEKKQNPEQPPSFDNFTSGGDKCGQWKKLKWKLLTCSSTTSCRATGVIVSERVYI